MLRLYVYLVLFFVPEIILAQGKDTTFQLPAVEISSSYKDVKDAGFKLLHFDSLILSDYKMALLPDLLQAQSALFLKNYGSGYSGTSFRGMAASHTAVFWNDVPVNSPMLGLTDLSLIPVTSADAIDVRLGGGSAVYGSGTAGGSIHLNSIPVFEDKLKIRIHQSLGSFGTYTGFASLQQGDKRWQSVTKLMYKKAKNNFLFPDMFTEGNPLKVLKNSENKRLSLMQDVYYKGNSGNLFSMHFWYQTGMRNIPPSMSMSDSRASENEHTFRTSAEWKKSFEKSQIQLISSYSYNNLLYRNPLNAIFSDSYYHTVFSKLQYNYDFSSKLRLQTGITIGLNTAFVNEYGIKREQNVYSYYAVFKYVNTLNTFKTFLSVRKDQTNILNAPWTPVLGIETTLYRSIEVYANAGKNYRIPTLNEMFWQPGGNPLLKPESGINTEVGITLGRIRDEKKFSFFTKANVYYNHVKDWIIWLPVSGVVWSPENLKTVVGRGFEYEFTSRLKTEKMCMQLRGNYAFTISTNEYRQDVNFGKQLMYVPYDMAQLSMRFETGGFLFSLSESFTGARYINNDNTQYLPSYKITNVLIGKYFIAGKYKIISQIELNNLFDEMYQSVEWIPMPGRYVGIRAGLEFN